MKVPKTLFNQHVTDRVCAHCLGMRGKGKEGQAIENHPIEEAVGQVLGGQQHDKHHHKFSIEHQEPSDDATRNAAAVSDEPHSVGATAGRGRGAVLWL